MAQLFGFYYVEGGVTQYIDYTNHILVPSYKVNRKAEYAEWTDANVALHRDILGERAEGSFTLIFVDPYDYREFIAYYEDALKDGYIDAKIYLNNKLAQVRTDIFMEFEPANEMPFMGRKDVEGIEVNIKERELHVIS